ncbi:MAG: hypothetical protein K2M02_08205 [Duncaniella sp.]|nr:hypothetical protein [Duncaniella sp.]MDE6495754.1 hypothetical protein [Duncaniella sp.]
MGNTWLWILAAVVYGVACGGVYTWMSPRRIGTWRLFLRSTAAFTVAGLVIVYILFRIFKA